MSDAQLDRLIVRGLSPEQRALYQNGTAEEIDAVLQSIICTWPDSASVGQANTTRFHDQSTFMRDARPRRLVHIGRQGPPSLLAFGRVVQSPHQIAGKRFPLVAHVLTTSLASSGCRVVPLAARSACR